VAVAGDVAGLCANEELAMSVANRAVTNDIKVFMTRILPVTDGSWQAPISRRKVRVSADKKRFVKQSDRRG